MDSKIERRTNIKFCVNLGKTPMQTYSMLKQAHGDQCLSLRQVYLWFNRYKSGETAFRDIPRPGRPKSVITFGNISRVRSLVNSNRRITIREMAEELNLTYYSVQRILTSELKMKRIEGTMVPRVLTEEQRQRRVEVAHDMLSRLCTDPTLLSRVITMDESWVYGYDPETLRVSTQWAHKDERRPQVAKRSKSKIKAMLLIFFDEEGVVFEDWLPSGRTVTASYHISVLHKLKACLKEKRPEKAANGWVLHHDNASLHTAKITQTFLDINGIELLPHAPYSPDQAPADFWLFYRIKKTMKGRRFQSIESIKENTRSSIQSIKKQEFQRVFHEGWVKRWKRCIIAGGEYFERDHITVDTEPAFRPICESEQDSIAADHPYSNSVSLKDLVLLDHDYC